MGVQRENMVRMEMVSCDRRQTFVTRRERSGESWGSKYQRLEQEVRSRQDEKNEKMTIMARRWNTGVACLTGRSSLLFPLLLGRSCSPPPKIKCLFSRINPPDKDSPSWHVIASTTGKCEFSREGSKEGRGKNHGRKSWRVETERKRNSWPETENSWEYENVRERKSDMSESEGETEVLKERGSLTVRRDEEPLLVSLSLSPDLCRHPNREPIKNDVFCLFFCRQTYLP